MSKQLFLDPRVRKLLKKGIEHHQAGRRGPAETCYRQSLKADPRCPQALHLLGLLAQQAGQYQESIRLIRESLALNPDDPDTLNSLADSYLGRGPGSGCQPMSANAWRNFFRNRRRPITGWARRRNGWGIGKPPRNPIGAPWPSSRIRPTFTVASAGCNTSKGHSRKRRESCRRALALDPHRHELYTQLGNALTDLGNYGAAGEAHRRALALKPDSAEAVYGLGYFFERKGDLASAVDSYRNALKLDPRLGAAHSSFGNYLYSPGRLGGSRRVFRRGFRN